MKITVSAAGPNPDSEVDPRFGRAPWFLFYDTETHSWESVPNQANADAAHGAGIQAAETVSRRGANVVITGHCGPKAFQVLEAAKVRVFSGDARTAYEALAAFQAGQLTELQK